MRMVPCLSSCLITTVLAVAVARADTVAAQLQVSARVLPHVRLEPAPVSTSVHITADDVERGYVDVAYRYTVRSNAPERVRLRFHPRASYARAVTLEGFGAAVPLHDASVEVSPAPGRDVSFDVRLWLAPGFEPGRYPSPVHLVAVVD